MELPELTYYLALRFTSDIGPRRLLALMQYFTTAERAFHALPHEIILVPGFSKEVAATFIVERDESLNKANAELQKLPSDVTILTYFDEGYPSFLKESYSPPALLYIRGNVQVLMSERMIAIVGSRKASDYGRKTAKEFAEGFVAERVTVVSGFAVGIDTIANHTAFASGGKTIAVLGSGVDVIYPSSNKELAREMIESGRGVIMSELPLGSAPLPEHFPPRNRIVSGLAKATVVIESAVKGGSLITAKFAFNDNRDVFAVPGDISRPSSGGPNQLIRENQAQLAESAEQVLQELGWSSKAGFKKERPLIDRGSLTMFEAKIVDVLEAAGGPLQIDALAERAGLDVQDILVQLLNLELKSIVRQMAGKQFMLVG